VVGAIYISGVGGRILRCLQLGFVFNA
jgi:hypothetical protein